MLCHCFILGREIQDDELQKFYGRVSKLLNANRDHGNETIDSLQRLNLIVSATKYAKTYVFLTARFDCYSVICSNLVISCYNCYDRYLRLPPDLKRKLQTLLLSKAHSEQFQVLFSSILRGSLPLSFQELSTGLAPDIKSSSYVPHVVLSQVKSPLI